MIRQAGAWRLIESSDVSSTRTALATETRFVSALLDATAAFVVTVDAEGRVIRCNSACEAVAGIPRSEIEGRLTWEAFPLTRERILGLIDDIWARGGSMSFESLLPTHDGGEIVVAWSTAGVRNDEGELAFVVATGQDITHHRQAEQKLQEAYEVEHRIAQTLQESLLRPVPEISGLRLGVVYKPAVEAERVGGDFYDIYELGAGKVVALIGDVSGKGVSAAGLTETVRSTLRALLYMNLSPAATLSMAGQVLHDQMLPEQFATVGIAMLDLNTNQIRYGSAGHPAPIRFGDTPRGIPVLQGVPLGACPYHYEQTTIQLEPSECLVMYTDGLADARRGKEFFGDRLLDAMGRQSSTPHKLVLGLLDEAHKFAEGCLDDDIAVVALQRTA